MKQKSIFKVADFPLVRRAKLRQVKIKDVPADGVIIFNVDELDVTAKKDETGNLVIRCPCDFCGKRGEAKNIMCGRKWAVCFYLLMHGGRVSEIEKEYEDKWNLLKKKTN